MNDIDIIEPLEPLEPLYDMLEMLIAKYGPMGIGAAMFAESAGVPFASAIVFITSGTLILRGSVSFWSIFIASTLGITLGSIFSYTLGLLGSMVGNVVRTGLFHRINPDRRASNHQENHQGNSRSKIKRLWDRYGNFSIFMAQLWGFSRTFISFPAGAMHMNLPIFVIYTTLGGALFSLGAIGLSIILTRTMSLTIALLKSLADLSPWLLAIPLGLAVLIVYALRTGKLKAATTGFKTSWRRMWQKLRRR